MATYGGPAVTPNAAGPSAPVSVPATTGTGPMVPSPMAGDQTMANPAMGPAVTGPQSTNPYNMAAGAMNAAGQAYMTAGQTPRSIQSMNAYLNPYYNEVIQGAIGNMTDTYQQNMNRIGSDALQGGAFGGSRHALLERGLTRDFQRDVGNMSNEMLMQRFDNANNMAFRDNQLIQSGLLAAGQGMQGLGRDYFGVGNQVTGMQAQSGAAQRQVLDRVLGLAEQDYNSYMQSPYAALDIIQMAMGRDPRQGNIDQSLRGVQKMEGSQQPGLMSIAGAGLQAWAGMP